MWASSQRQTLLPPKVPLCNNCEGCQLGGKTEAPIFTKILPLRFGKLNRLFCSEFRGMMDLVFSVIDEMRCDGKETFRILYTK